MEQLFESRLDLVMAVNTRSDFVPLRLAQGVLPGLSRQIEPGLIRPDPPLPIASIAVEKDHRRRFRDGVCRRAA